MLSIGFVNILNEKITNNKISSFGGDIEVGFTIKISKEKLKSLKIRDNFFGFL